MTTSISFVGAGVGDMAIIDCADGSKLFVDCYLTNVTKPMAMPSIFALADSNQVDAFVALNVSEHRVRGLSELCERLLIRKIWDTSVPLQAEFEGLDAYRKLRQQCGVEEIDRPKVVTFGATKIGVVRAVTEAAAATPGGPMIMRLAETDPQSGEELGSILFASDATADFWTEAVAVLPTETLASDVLVLGDHGGTGCFRFAEDPTKTAAIEHFAALRPRAIVAGGIAGQADDQGAADLLQTLAGAAGAELIFTETAGSTIFEIGGKGVTVEIDDQRRPLARPAAAA